MWTTFIIIAATSKACLFCISPALCSSSRLRLCSQVTSLLTCNAQDTKVLDDTRTSASFLLLPERGNLRCWATAFWQLGWERGLGQPGSQAPCLPPSASRDNPQEPGKGGQGLKPQINDISVASNAGTINPIIYRVASGLSFKLPSQTMAGQSPLPGFPERLREHGAKLASGGQHWDSPPVTCHLQGGSLGTLRGPGAQRRKICLLQKLSRAAGGRWPGSRKSRFEAPELPRLPLWPWQLTRSWESRTLGGGQEPLYLGEKGRCRAPPPPGLSQSWMSAKLLFPLPAQLLPVCLHGNQAKRLICQCPGSRAYLGAGFSVSFWKPVHCHSQEPPTASSSHCVGGTLGQLEKVHPFINLIPLKRGKAALGPMGL